MNKKPAVKKATAKKAVAPKIEVVEQMPNGNVVAEVDKATGLVHITINPKWTLGESGSGKSEMIASTGAPRLIILADGRKAKLGLNFFIPVTANKAFA